MAITKKIEVVSDGGGYNFTPSEEKFNREPWSTNQSFMLSRLPGTARYTLYTTRLDRESSLYLFNVNTQEEVKLRLIPDQVAESYNPRLVSVSPFGTVTPLNFYVGGEAKKISFSFNMHEDLQNVNGSIYDMVDLILKMLEPVYKEGILYDPLVYFQLGDQFAGKGHLEVSFTYNKPFRNGRYINVSCSMSFIFHEEFMEDPISLDDNYKVEFSPLSYNVDILEDEAAVDDFIKFQTDPQYYITQVFGDKKFETYFNKVATRQGTSNAERGVSEVMQTILSGERVQASQYFKNQWAIDLINMFFDLGEILNTGYEFLGNVTIYSNLMILYNSYLTFKEEYYASGGLYRFVQTVGYEEVVLYLQMSDEEMSAFEELLSLFENTIDHQIAAYSDLMGGGN